MQKYSVQDDQENLAVYKAKHLRIIYEECFTKRNILYLDSNNKENFEKQQAKLSNCVKNNKILLDILMKNQFEYRTLQN